MDPYATISSDEILAFSRSVLRQEAEAILSVTERIDASFYQAAALILKCEGRVIVSGVGKSGHVGKKMAATLASTGTPAFFLHAGEAGHGDLGMITQKDLVLAISNSGESEEVVSMAIFAKMFGADVISVTGNKNSRLSQHSIVHLDAAIEKEACPLGVAPTSSTIVQMALCDALAMTLVRLRGFTISDFAKTHPLGSIGRRYFLKVKDVMQRLCDVPHVGRGTPLSKAIEKMSYGRVGAVLVIEEAQIRGIFTDSDFRRLISTNQDEFAAILKEPIDYFMVSNPKVICDNSLSSESIELFERHRVSRLVCINEKSFVSGLLSLHDILNKKNGPTF